MIAGLIAGLARWFQPLLLGGLIMFLAWAIIMACSTFYNLLTSLDKET